MPMKIEVTYCYPCKYLNMGWDGYYCKHPETLIDIEDNEEEYSEYGKRIGEEYTQPEWCKLINGE